MNKYLCLTAIAIAVLSSGNVYATETVNVLILPFEINAQEELSYLKNQIPQVIKNHLKHDGAGILEPDPGMSLSITEPTGFMDKIRKIGDKSGATHVIWGSITIIGQHFSLDTKMIGSSGDELPYVFFYEGEGIENLSGSLKELSRDLGMKIFKREKISKVLVNGNKRIETDAIRRVIKADIGSIYHPKNLAEDLKAVYAMGYFDDVRIESESTAEGKSVIFKVKEKPTIRVIIIKGNRIYEDEKIKEVLNLKTGSILNYVMVQKNIERIEGLYKDKNYHNARVEYKISEHENNQADLEFVITEGSKVLIKSIIFEGNKAYLSSKLKKLMSTSEKSIFSLVTSAGDLNREDLNQDVAKLASFYHNNGFIQAKVGEPKIDAHESWIDITIKIDEGPQFKVGKVEITGDLVFPQEKLIENIKIGKEKYYNRQVLQRDILALTDIYSDEGYAYADIAPSIDQDRDKMVVNINFIIKKGKQVYFEEIVIGGNTKTRDRVIRRELLIYEQELYSGVKLKKSMRNLHRLDYFEDIKVDTSKGSSDDKMLLKINIAEKPTGTFSFGAGYSSIEKVFGMASIAQRNLFGKGQMLALKTQLGAVSNRYTLSFTEPWWFDIPLSAGFDLYSWEYDYDTYDKDSKGGGIRFGYPVYDYTKIYLNYAFDDANIRNIETDAPDTIKEMEGNNISSSVMATLKYDSRDKIFNPTEGSEHTVSVQYAGLGGDIGFTRYIAETGWYIPLFKGTVGSIHAKTGYVSQNSEGKLPTYERFDLGGINSLRGFESEDLSPKKLNSEGVLTEIGGNKFVQFNLEFLFPLIKEAGVMCVLFFDTGDVYDNHESINFGNLRESVGGGIRWYSPMGPMRIEYGYILDPVKDAGEGGKWEFTMGTVF
ncbi:MAG: outer membrane protein assembly factor BamA [Desulfobacteraceae bacterium]|nr:MAG: outer membrane protein assembly factor BamA [Desulfobacteraceae bacterium]